MYKKKQEKNSMVSWSTNFIITIIAQPKFSTTMSPSSGKPEEGDMVVENFGCAIIVIIKFVDQDTIEFFSCFFLYIRQPVEFFSVIYMYIYKCIYM